MTTKPRLADLFCGGGGAALGYRKYFDVTGVDQILQPRYPGHFMQADALEFLVAHGHRFDAIHASPPCPRSSRITPWQYRNGWKDWIGPIREALIASGKPWVIENVVGAPLRRDIELCGTQFGLPLYRHRIFEVSWLNVERPEPCVHTRPTWYPWDKRRESYGTPYEPGFIIPVHGDNNAPAHLQMMAMGIEPEQMSRKQMIKAIPPAFAEFVGAQMRKKVR